jgi:AbrB family looped-hinge helix DNA binding protein
MDAVTISKQFQIVIPQKIRRALNLRPGQKVQVFKFVDRIELVPIKQIEEMRRYVKGINVEINRDEDRF